MLALVLLRLRRVDRLNSALVCRRWARIMSSSVMLEDICLNIAGFEINAAASALSKSTRQHRNILLHKGITNTRVYDRLCERLGENHDRRRPFRVTDRRPSLR